MTKKKSNEAAHFFNSSWWSVELPRGWIASKDPECVTLRAQPPLGALQISSARKDKADVTEEDLRDLARECSAPLSSVRYGLFSGFASHYLREGLFWQQWWLRSGRLMLYVTYNVSQGGEDLERDKIQVILASLTPI